MVAQLIHVSNVWTVCCDLRLQGHGLVEVLRGEGLVSGDWAEPEEAAVCGSHVEAAPVCASIQEGLLCSGLQPPGNIL